MTNDKFRGFEIKKRNKSYIFVDTGESVADTWRNRPCGFCGQHNTPEGHDGCLGTIVSAMNACCGHGITESAYIQFENGTIIRGEAVINWLEQHYDPESEDLPDARIIKLSKYLKGNAE